MTLEAELRSFAAEHGVSARLESDMVVIADSQRVVRETIYPGDGRAGPWRAWEAARLRWIGGERRAS